MGKAGDIMSENSLSGWFAAAKAGDLAGLTQGVNAGVDINARDEKQNTALHWASKFHHHDCMRYLIDNGADVDTTNDRDDTPLHIAERNEGAIRILLEAGSDPNKLNKDYNYPYYFAFYGAMTPEITALYIKHGANLIYKKDM